MTGQTEHCICTHSIALTAKKRKKKKASSETPFFIWSICLFPFQSHWETVLVFEINLLSRGNNQTYQCLKFFILEFSCSVYFVNESFCYLWPNSLLSTGSNIIGIYCRLFTSWLSGHDFVLLTSVLLWGTCWNASETRGTSLFPSAFPQTLAFAKWIADRRIRSVQGIFRCL